MSGWIEALASGVLGTGVASPRRPNSYTGKRHQRVPDVPAGEPSPREIFADLMKILITAVTAVTAVTEVALVIPLMRVTPMIPVMLGTSKAPTTSAVTGVIAVTTVTTVTVHTAVI